MAYSEVDNLIHAGVILGVYLFIAILVYFLLGMPIDAILDGINTGGQIIDDVRPHMNLWMPYILEAVQIAFALGIAYPVTWFIFWVFSRESDVNIFRVR